MAEPAAEGFRGQRVLVVEDEYMIAIELARSLEGLGASVVGPAASVEDALELIASERVDSAVLDINLGRERAYPVAAVLRERGVPFIFTTGYDAWIIEGPYQTVPRCEKPVDPRLVARLLTSG